MQDQNEMKKSSELEKQLNSSHEEVNDFEFLQEKIKERPINKKKLLQRMLITGGMALLFGLIACLTFLLLEPVLNNWLHPEKEPNLVMFPEEAEEILPEDMLSEENNKQQTQETESSKEDESSYLENMKEIQENLNKELGTLLEQDEEFRITQYQLLYKDLYQLSGQIKTNLVQVTGVSSNIDWFNNLYENKGKSTGLIVANNGKELLILCHYQPIRDAQTITVTFCDETIYDAELKKYDKNTDLAIIDLPLETISKELLNKITVAKLGSSHEENLVGQPIIAIGQTTGISEAVSYGMVTSNSNVLTMPDNEFKILTTDILSGQNASGVLVNLKGEIIGIIKNEGTEEKVSTLTAIGISELKGVISKLSNNISIPYLGIYVVDVPMEVHASYQIPRGAYITNIDMDSPAMHSGMQKGDIVIKVGDQKIEQASDYMSAVRKYVVDKTVTITVLRPTQDAFQEMSFELVVESRE